MFTDLWALGIKIAKYLYFLGLQMADAELMQESQILRKKVLLTVRILFV